MTQVLADGVARAALQQLCYHDDASAVELLTVLLNRAQNAEHFAPAVVCKRYTAIAQAMLISARKHEGLWLRSGLSDDNLCRHLSPLLDPTDTAIDISIESISDRFQAQLQKDKVVGLPDIFLPLARHYGLAKQAQVATASVGYLKSIGIITEMGRTDEERLQIAAQACGELCFKHDFTLRADLDDSMLPDLLAKFAIMERALEK
ncbi:hypothetical protein MY10362_009537 [Beauveria mimosiformis]